MTDTRRQSLSWLTPIVGLAVAGALVSSDPRTLALSRNTLLIAGGACLLALPLGSFLALCLSRTDAPLGRMNAALLGVMLLIPLYLQAAGWDAGFGQLGWYSSVRGAVGSPWLQGWPAVVGVHGLAATPWVALIVSAGLRYAPPELEEQALLDGSPWRVLLHVTMRSAAPSLLIATLWVAATTAADMTVTDLYRVRTLAEELYTGFALGDDLADAWRRSLAVVIAVFSLSWGVFDACFRLAPRQVHAPWRPRWVFTLGRWRWPLGGIILLLVGLIVAAPLANLAYQAGSVVVQQGDARVRTWSASQLVEVIASSPWRFRSEFGWSLIIAVFGASAATALAIPLGWSARRGGWRRLPAVSAAAFCLSLPGPLIGLTLIWLLGRWQSPGLIWLYDRTIFAPVVAVCVRSLPVTILIVWFAFQGVSPALVETARIEGAGPIARLWHSGVRLRGAALIGAWLAAAAVCLGDLAASVLVLPPGVTTLSRRVFGLMHAGVRTREAGICLTLAAGSALLALGVLKLLDRAGRDGPSTRPGKV